MNKSAFPILQRQVHGRPLVYLDNAATTQKPQCVIDAIAEMYATTNANVHRGVHYLSQKSTELHEQARKHVRQFIGARSNAEIIFTRGTTESINLVASSYGDAFLQEGDEVLLTTMEHHSNIVPWQLLQARKGIHIRVLPIADDGSLILDEIEKYFTSHTKLLSITHVSNVLGTVNPIQQLVKIAHDHGCHVLVDAAQSVPHLPVNVQELGCDFLAFSGHKIYGPTGIGVLYGREELLSRMPPYQGGGEMISTVTFERTTYEQLPYKFEAGTPDYTGSHALSAALSFIEKNGMDNVRKHEHNLTHYAMERLRQIKGIQLYGETETKEAVVAFNLQGIHHLDVGTLLDQLGIAIRTGHHCAQPLMERYGVDGMCRASFALYNTLADIDALIMGLERIRKMFN